MEEKKLRTAAYCRVSTASDTQDGSFEVQCAYYEKLIKDDPNMEFVGVYGDHGKSGRSMRGRKELNRLIRDCEAGKVDLVLTKSISRFARNMLECVNTIRQLSDLGVTVRFEKENLDTETMGGELMLGILATIAQEESNSISQNINWSRQKHVEKGQPWDVARYGYVSVGKEHRWEVVDHEAEAVRQAFYMAGMCHTYGEIAEELTRMEAEDGKGRVWNKAPIVNLLRSETYIGNYLSNKECSIVDENGIVKRVKNKGYVDQILIENHHPALVSKELYDVVQELLDHQTLGGHRRKFSEEEREIMGRAMKLAAKEAQSWQRAV
ncbi:MAG: recombinase family protein [Oribacterium sp.]|nr:recombinase family protein [Oribacterium sp.]